MTEPSACAVMITNNRPRLAARAVQCFNRQTYKNKLLYVLDTSKEAPCGAATDWEPSANGSSIGFLRNAANSRALCQLQPDILINWDDDDWSHPNRIVSQVAQLTGTQIDRRMYGGGIVPAPAVGYKDLLWWDSTKGEAWLYDNGSNHYCLGTSLCYWPETWRRFPFPDPKVDGGHDVGEWPEAQAGQFGFSSIVNGEPMIIGEYHGANGACQIKPSDEYQQNTTWKRAAEWDFRLRERMQLAVESGK